MAEPAPARGRPALGQGGLVTARVVDAAWQVLMESGPESFALDRVAAVAHASKQTIYARFAGRLELLEAVLDARIGLLYAAFDEAASSDRIEQVVAQVTRSSVSLLSAPEALMLERLIDWIDRSRPEASLRERIHGEMLGRLRGCLDQARATGQLPDCDTAMAAGFWLDGLIGHVRGPSRHHDRLDDWARAYAGFFLRAIGRGDLPPG